MYTVENTELDGIVAEAVKGKRPQVLRIDDAVPEEVLHQFSPETVMEIARKLGFLIEKCMYDHNYKANGVWLKPEGQNLEQLSSYHNLSHGYCPACEQKVRQLWGG